MSRRLGFPIRSWVDLPHFYDHSNSVTFHCHELILSAPNLTFLCLGPIPRSGPKRTSPEAMVNSLSVLTRLKSLGLTFGSETPRPQSQQSRGHPPSFSRVVLPALTNTHLHGDKEHLEDFVSRIDTPLLADITIRFSHIDQPMPVAPPLRDFISRIEKSGACSKIDTNSSCGRARIQFFRRDGQGL